MKKVTLFMLFLTTSIFAQDYGQLEAGVLVESDFKGETWGGFAISTESVDFLDDGDLYFLIDVATRLKRKIQENDGAIKGGIEFGGGWNLGGIKFGLLTRYDASSIENVKGFKLGAYGKIHVNYSTITFNIKHNGQNFIYGAGARMAISEY